MQQRPTAYTMTAPRERAWLASIARATNKGITVTRAIRWIRPRHVGRTADATESELESKLAAYRFSGGRVLEPVTSVR
jgi:hypothetical protein